MGRITNELFGPRVCLKNLAMNKHHSFPFFFPSLFFFFWRFFFLLQDLHVSWLLTRSK